MLEQEVIEAEKKWAQLVVANAKSILVRNNKIATRALYNSVRYTVNSQGEIKFITAPEGRWVTYGRKPNKKFPWPDGDPAPISRWIRQKGITGGTKDGRPLSNQQLTFLISRAIARDGIKPLPFITLAVQQSLKQLAKEMAKAKTKALIRRLRLTTKP